MLRCHAFSAAESWILWDCVSERFYFLPSSVQLQENKNLEGRGRERGSKSEQRRLTTYQIQAARSIYDLFMQNLNLTMFRRYEVQRPVYDLIYCFVGWERSGYHFGLVSDLYESIRTMSCVLACSCCAPFIDCMSVCICWESESLL
jgi:hypothetical protein